MRENWKYIEEKIAFKYERWKVKRIKKLETGWKNKGQKVNTLAAQKKQISEMEGSAPAWVVDPSHPHFEAAARATQTVYGVAPDLIREGGSIPITISLQVK